MVLLHRSSASANYKSVPGKTSLDEWHALPAHHAQLPPATDSFHTHPANDGAVLEIIYLLHKNLSTSRKERFLLGGDLALKDHLVPHPNQMHVGMS